MQQLPALSCSFKWKLTVFSSQRSSLTSVCLVFILSSSYFLSETIYPHKKPSHFPNLIPACSLSSSFLSASDAESTFVSWLHLLYSIKNVCTLKMSTSEKGRAQPIRFDFCSGCIRARLSARFCFFLISCSLALHRLYGVSSTNGHILLFYNSWSAPQRFNL